MTFNSNGFFNDSYVSFLKSYAVINPQGNRDYHNPEYTGYGIFYYCLSCDRIRISKKVFFCCPFCSSVDLRIYYLFPNHRFESFFDIKTHHIEVKS
jgi:hypothetical protein